MKTILGILVGGLVALAIACGGSAKQAAEPPPPGGPQHGGGMPGDPRAEIDRLDGAITAEMEKLGEARPEPAADACVQRCGAQAMSGAATAATTDDATCKPGSGATCSESCTLKKSICENAGRICELAAKLGGADAYANDKCNRGSASCDAAKKRCCTCS